LFVPEGEIITGAMVGQACLHYSSYLIVILFRPDESEVPPQQRTPARLMV
jgi:hypothetical protein